MHLSDEMQVQAKALSDPSRFRIFRHIVESAEPVHVAELTELLGFNHNAIRQHLKVLVDAGLVAETTERRTERGRPRKLYVARSDALRSFESGTGSHERLAAMLLDLHLSGAEPYGAGFAEGVRSSPAMGDATPALDEVTDKLFLQLSTSGFEPSRRDDGVAVLANCPFASLAGANPEVICEMHRGLIDGFLAGQGRAAKGELTVKPAHRAGCLVQIVDHVGP